MQVRGVTGCSDGEPAPHPPGSRARSGGRQQAQAHTRRLLANTDWRSIMRPQGRAPLPRSPSITITTLGLPACRRAGSDDGEQLRSPGGKGGALLAEPSPCKRN